jgi:HK97 gp10 family phage protein
MSLDWFGDKVNAKLREENIKRLARAAIFLENEIKGQLGVKGAAISGRDKSGRFTQAVYEASAAGDFPHLQTGELRRSVTHEVDESKMVARVGTNKLYARFLEMGTGKMEPRPFLERTLEANRPQLREILTGKG